MTAGKGLLKKQNTQTFTHADMKVFTREGGDKKKTGKKLIFYFYCIFYKKKSNQKKKKGNLHSNCRNRLAQQGAAACCCSVWPKHSRNNLSFCFLNFVVIVELFLLFYFNYFIC